MMSLLSGFNTAVRVWSFPEEVDTGLSDTTGCFEFGRGAIPQSSVTSDWVVEDLDTVGNASSCLVCCVAGLQVHPFSFQRRNERLRDGIVIAVAGSVHAVDASVCLGDVAEQ